MTRLAKIKEEAEQYDKNKLTDYSTNQRFRELIKQYGLEEVSAASGLKVSTLLYYTNRTNPYRASLDAVLKAETILSKI